MNRSIFFIFILFLIGCSPFSEYNEKENGLYMKLCSFDESNVAFRPTCYKEASIRISSKNGLVFRNFRQHLITAQDKRLNFLFRHLTEGDSAQFKISAALFHEQFNLPYTETEDEIYYDATVKVYRYLKQAPSNFEPEMQEQIILKHYLLENNITTSKNGVFVQPLVKGKGQKIKRDKVVTIHYIGRFINELEFDNTYKSGSFTFTYGTPGQVIKGLDIALKGMKAGEKAKIIIPSQLAFEDEGSSTGVVPPYSTVIYDLEIVNVK